MAFSREPQTNYPNYQDSAGHTEAVVWCLEQRCLPTALSVLGKGHSCLRTHPAPGADPAEKITWQIQVKQIKPSVGKFPSSPPPSDCAITNTCAPAQGGHNRHGGRGSAQNWLQISFISQWSPSREKQDCPAAETYLQHSRSCTGTEALPSPSPGCSCCKPRLSLSREQPVTAERWSRRKPWGPSFVQLKPI